MSKTKRIVTSLTFHMAIGITVWFLLFNAITSVIGYYSFTNSYREEYKQSAFRAAELSKAVVTGDYIDEYLSFSDKGTVTDQNGNEYFDIDSFKQDGEYGEAYADQWKRLDILSHKLDVNLVYVIAVDTTDYASFQSVINCPNNDKVPYKPWTIGHTEKTNEQYVEIYKKMYAGELDEAYVMRTDNLDGAAPHVIALLPIENSAGETSAILCVQRSMEELAGVSSKYLTRTLLSTIGLIIISVAVMVLYLHKEVVSPTHKIIAEAERFSGSNSINEEFKLDEKTKIREIQQMATSLKSMENDIVQHIDNLTAVTAERERINTELSLAKSIQAHVLPSLFPPFPDKNEFEIFASMTPAKEVGGDFYDFFLLDEDHLGLVMADVSGKGVPAALFMMATKNLIKSYAMLGGTPGEILTRVNKEICKNNADDMFVTVWLGILTISTGKVIASNAGHEYPAIKRRNGQFELFKDKHGFVIGGMDIAKYRDYEFELGVGDSLFVYTDGVAEANDKDNRLFGLERMLGALNDSSSAAPKDILSSVRSAIDTFVGDADQFDDITMMAITMKYLHDENSVTVSPNEESYNVAEEFLRNHLQKWNVSNKTRVRMEIAFDEVFSNIQNYSGATMVKLTLAKNEDEIQMQFSDDGIPFDPTEIPKPDVTLSAEERQIGGLGMYMVREQSKEMVYEYKDSRNILKLSFVG